MARFMKGNVVVVPFPFSDLTQARRRPAFVIASVDAIPINDSDFETGSLKQPSNMRPNRLFTADSHIILYQIGSLRKNKVKEIISKVIEIVRK